MALLSFTDPVEAAAGSGGSGIANYIVDNGTSQTLEVWERIVPVGTPAPPPPFSLAGTFAGPAPTPVARPVPLGALLQVRLSRDGMGRSDGAGQILGRLDLPCISMRNGRTP